MGTDIPQTMKALLLTNYNQLEIANVPVPVPGYKEVLCRIKAVAICGSDPGIIKGFKPGVWPKSFPFILGHEWSGEVASLGEGVTELKVGDRVAGEAHSGCGICKNCLAGDYTLCLNYGRPGGHRHYGFNYNGSNCEYNAFPIKCVHKIPDDLSYVHATLVDTGGVSLHAVKLIGITPGGSVAIYGGGPVGLCVLQLVKGMGSTNIIVIGSGGYRLELARKYGADHTVDYKSEDPVAAIMKYTDGIGADEAVECSGADIAPAQCVRSLRKGGKLALIGFTYSASMPFPVMSDVTLNQITIQGSRANPNVSEEVIHLLGKKIIDGDTLITHRFPLDRYKEALDIFSNKKDNCLKVVIEP